MTHEEAVKAVRAILYNLDHAPEHAHLKPVAPGLMVVRKQDGSVAFEVSEELAREMRPLLEAAAAHAAHREHIAAVSAHDEPPKSKKSKYEP